jgi:hypothetical protein
VPYADRAEAKALGARWCVASRRWYVEGRGLAQFEKWLETPMTNDIDIEKATANMPAKSSRMAGVVPMVAAGSFSG